MLSARLPKRISLGIVLLAVLSVVPASAQYEIYRGNFHVHTLASYEPTSSLDHAATDQPDVTMQKASSEGLNIVGLSDHGGNIDSSEWENLGSVANQYQSAPTVALRGFEWTWKGLSDSDHINVFGSDSYTDVAAVGTGTPPTTTGESLANFYTWLEGAAPAAGYGSHPVAQFNHIYYGTHFNNFGSWDTDLDSLLCLAEIGCSESPGAYDLANPASSEPYFRMALQAGWHVAPSINIDNQFGIGDQAATRHTAILVTPGSGRAGVMDALRARRVFASEDEDFELTFRCEVDDSSWYYMGQVIPAGGSTFKFYVIAYDPNSTIDEAKDHFASVDLMCSGQASPVHSWGAQDSTVFTGNRTFTYQEIRALPMTSQGETALYLRIRQTGLLGAERDYIYSAPIWIHHYTPAPGTITTNITWKASGSPYVVTGLLVVPAGTQLTIEPGAVVKFARAGEGYPGGFEVHGSILAQGTAQSPIYFTSLKDDSVGGDTNGDGSASSPAAGDWFHIAIYGGTGTFDHCIARYGGFNDPSHGFSGYGELVCIGSSGSMSVTNCTVTQSQTCGVYNTLPAAVVRNCIVAYNGLTAHI